MYGITGNTKRSRSNNRRQEVTDPDTAARIKRIARELEIEKQFGIVGAELAKSRLKRKYLYKT